MLAIIIKMIHIIFLYEFHNVINRRIFFAKTKSNGTFF